MGRRAHPPYLINGFRLAVEFCGFRDLGMKGHQFTWEKGRGTPNFTEEKLDRVLATKTWCRLFPNCSSRQCGDGLLKS